MTITLYNNPSAANVVSKSITRVDTLTGNLRSPTSITDPVVQIQRSSPIGFNYFYIAEFSRYYFLKSVTVGTTGLITISGHVDVLMSFADDIRNTKAVIFRQENRYNLYLDDGTFKCYQNPKHKIKTFPNAFNDFSFIFAIAGNAEAEE